MKPRPSITILTPGLSAGGAQKVAINLANEWSRLGLDVELLVLKSSGAYFDQVSRKVKITIFDSKKVSYSVFALYRHFTKTKPNIVLSVIRDTNILVGFLSFFVTNIKFYGREANTMDAVFKKSFVSKYFYLKTMKLIYKRLEGIIANSSYTLKDLIKNDIEPENSCVIGNPVITKDCENLLEAEVNDTWLNSKHLKTILSIGRLSPQKNHPLLIKAFSEVYKKHKDSRLIIIGEGNEENNLKSIINEYKLKEVVKILPFQKNVYKYLKYAKVFVLSSIYEGFGNVVVEALYSETEVVITNSPGGTLSIIKDGELGTIVDNGSDESLSEGISKILSRRSHNRGSILKERALDFNVVDMASDYLDFIIKKR